MTVFFIRLGFAIPAVLLAKLDAAAALRHSLDVSHRRVLLLWYKLRDEDKPLSVKDVAKGQTRGGARRPREAPRRPETEERRRRRRQW